MGGEGDPPKVAWPAAVPVVSQSRMCAAAAAATTTTTTAATTTHPRGSAVPRPPCQHGTAAVQARVCDRAPRTTNGTGGALLVTITGVGGLPRATGRRSDRHLHSVHHTRRVCGGSQRTGTLDHARLLIVAACIVVVIARGQRGA